jgi:tRNA-binding protein
MSVITWDQFEQVDLRVGTITKAEEFAEAHNPSYKLWIDFGSEIGIKKSSAQITDLYSPGDLIDKQIIGIVNLPPKQIGPFTSECLVTGFYRANGDVVLATPELDVPNGCKLS